MKRNTSILALALASAVAFTGCDKRDNFVLYEPGVKENVVQVAQQNGLNLFASAMQATGMDTTFQQLGQFTVFAPTDSAFQAAGVTAASVNSMDKSVLRTLLRNHILSGRTLQASFLPGPNATYQNLNRENLFVSVYNGQAFVNGFPVRRTDLIANNGVIHSIAGILAPASVNFTTTLNRSADSANLTFFQAALVRANLVNSVNNPANVYTVFAPTNAAFQAAGFADLNAINNADPAVLSAILRYHIITATAAAPSGGRIFAPDIRFRYTNPVNTLQGTPVTFTAAGGVRGTTNTADANVVRPNILYRNGVVHLIDRVLTP